MALGLAATLGLTVGQGIFKGILARKQAKAAKNLKKDNYIPPSLVTAEKSARRRANTTQLPGASTLKDDVSRSSSNFISRARRAGKSSADIMAAGSAANIQENQVSQNINKALQEYKVGQEQNLEGIQRQKAGFEQGNEESFRAAQSALRGSSLQNIHSAIGDIASGVIGVYGDKEAVGDGGVTDESAVISKITGALGNTSFANDLIAQYKAGTLTKEALDAIMGLGVSQAGKTAPGRGSIATPQIRPKTSGYNWMNANLNMDPSHPPG